MSTDTVTDGKKVHPALVQEGEKINELLTLEDRYKYQRIKKTDFATELLYHESLILYYDNEIKKIQERKSESEQEILEIQTFGDAAARAKIKEIRKAQEKQTELETELKALNPDVDFEAVGIRPAKATSTKEKVKKNGK